ncbi:MAG TPA: c-type cytochrome [Vicinamibacterales bacterium]
MHKRYFAGLLVVMLGCWGVAVAAQQAQGTAPAIKRGPAAPTRTLEGPDTYDAYCAVCHGKDGKGNGPAAKALKAPLTDLTTLASRHNGVFPRKDVEEMISGVNRPAAHGTQDMPMWGPVFKAVNSSDEFALVRMKSLLDYLEKMQAK